MSFGGLILTNAGRNRIAAAVSEKKPLQFTQIQLGDGVYKGSYLSKTELTNKIMEIPVTSVVRKDNEVIISCDWDSKQASEGFYLREIGIIGNGVLCYYDNAGNGDTEYIDPESEVMVKQKRFRFTISVTDDVEITTVIASGLYALSETVTQEMAELDDKKLNKEDLIVPNVPTNDQTPTYTEASKLTKLTSGEKLSVAFGKISKAITDLIVHIGDSVKHITSSERTLWNTVSNKVDKVSGKGLSTNDYTTTEKNKLAGIASGANAYSLPLATSSVRGGAKVGYSQNGRNYPVQLSNEQLYVNVPWTDTNTNTWRGIQNNLTSDSTTDSLSATQGKVLKGLIDGKAPSSHNHNYLTLYGERQTSGNFATSTNGTGSMFHFVATSSMTSGKPPADANCLQMNWDNNGGWDAQFGISNGNNCHAFIRSQDSGTWSSWYTLLDSANYNLYAATKTWKDIHLYVTSSSRSISIYSLLQADTFHEAFVHVYETTTGNNYGYSVPIPRNTISSSYQRIITGYSTNNASYAGRLEVQFNIQMVTLNAFFCGNVDYTTNCHMQLYYR